MVDWTVHWSDHLPPGVLGLTDYARRTVTLALGMTQAERRSTIAHELVHIERGPVPAAYVAREERIVDVITARQLVDFHELVDAMVWSLDEHEIADALWVDPAVVVVRLRTLTPLEAAVLNQRLDDAELLLP
ncbi:hypothetical protein [Nocardioides campestrisoli]|uniref:hypothetical protein n=1 Tax=Nocardioides campestrisoli TaxID=2736757 RepID=UPI0015E64219|nr:hypothetical protein [Nocardioides campestrisoli]